MRVNETGLTFQRLNESGTYECRAVNRLGSVAKQFHVTLDTNNSTRKRRFYSYGPQIAGNKIEKVTIAAPNKLQLTCDASGLPKPKVTWLHVSSTIKKSSTIIHIYKSIPQNKTKIVSNQNVTVNDRELTIRSVRRNGTYECMATNRLGSVSKQFVVTWIAENAKPLYGPRIAGAKKEQIFAQRNARLVLFCNATGMPTPKVTWFYVSRLLPENACDNLCNCAFLILVRRRNQYYPTNV